MIAFSILSLLFLDIKKIRDYFGRDYREVVKLISEVLKNGKEKYDAYTVLRTPRLLYFLIALDRPHELYNYYDKCLVDIYDYQKDLQLYDANIKYNRYVPLSTVYRLANVSEYIFENPWDEIFSKSPSYNLYNLCTSKKLILPPKHLNYYFPEGIKEIDNETLPVDDTTYSIVPLVNAIHAKSKDKTVIFPRSMRKVTGNIFVSGVKYFCLNEGLEELGENALIASKHEELDIPSTLFKIDTQALNYSFIKRVVFNNFKDSKLLQNDEELKQFLSNFFYLDKYELKEEIDKISQDGYFPNQKLYSSWRSGINKFTVKTKLEMLAFEDNGEEYYIDLSNLRFKTQFNFSEYKDLQIEEGTLSSGALTKLVRLLRKEITNETGYSFKDDENILKNVKQIDYKSK